MVLNMKEIMFMEKNKEKVNIIFEKTMKNKE